MKTQPESFAFWNVIRVWFQFYLFDHTAFIPTDHGSFRSALESFLKAQVFSSESTFRLATLSSALLVLLALMAALCLLVFPLLPALNAGRDCSVKSNLIADFTAMLEDLRETQRYILTRRFPIVNPDDVEGCIETLESKSFASATVMTYQVIWPSRRAAGSSDQSRVKFMLIIFKPLETEDA